jgi:hypothetical protein
MIPENNQLKRQEEISNGEREIQHRVQTGEERRRGATQNDFGYLVYDLRASRSLNRRSMSSLDVASKLKTRPLGSGGATEKHKSELPGV